MATQTTKQALRVEGLPQTLKAINAFGRDANVTLRNVCQKIATATAQQATSKSQGIAQQAPLAGSSLRARRDRVPVIVGGGASRVGTRNLPVGGLFFGAEFGGGARPTTRQFLRHRGQAGYFLWPTIRERAPADIALYNLAIDSLCIKWQGAG